MADPLIPASAGDIIEKVGFAVAAILGLLYVVRWLSQVHLKALNDRITTLEGVIKERDAIIEKRESKIDDQQREHMATVISHAHDMKSLVMQLLANDKSNRDFMREHQHVLVGLFEKLNARPCLVEDYKPHPTPKPELPPVPGTDRAQKHG